MKFLVLLPYFNRPRMVQSAILSVIEDQPGVDLVLAICDDGSSEENSAMKIGNQFRGENVFIYRKEPYDKSGGSLSGELLNLAMSEIEHDICVVLCDDDMLIPGALAKLENFYTRNPDIEYSYGIVFPYDPTSDDDGPIPENYDFWLNKSGLIMPVCQVDASQVSWRSSAGVQFPHPQTAALDATVFQYLFEKFGPCYPNKVPVQYKAVFWDQLGNRLLEGRGVEPEVP